MDELLLLRSEGFLFVLPGHEEAADVVIDRREGYTVVVER